VLNAERYRASHVLLAASVLLALGIINLELVGRSSYELDAREQRAQKCRQRRLWGNDEHRGFERRGRLHGCMISCHCIEYPLAKECM
jgi:hypothetical protein